MKIRVLPDNLANQIAAGEVVERPASVIKELVENSIDAGATQIVVDIELGGRRLMRVADNGEGMRRDDAILAFERHATSKIRSLEDLGAIGTLGFRGEALASIASVAKVELITKVADEIAATRVVIEGGRLLDVTDAGRDPGTTIAVRDLFFNTPARRKFMRSEATENYHLTSIVTHYALAHPEISFTLTTNGREAIRVSPTRDLRERSFQLFGSGLIESLLPVNGGRVHVAKVSGFVSAPRERRTNRDQQYFFVNQRFVRDKTIAGGLLEGYRSVLPHGVYPVAFLFLDVPTDEIDVNVHPAKTEIRFRRNEAVKDVIAESIRNALATAGIQVPIVDDEPSKLPATETIAAPNRLESPPEAVDLVVQPSIDLRPVEREYQSAAPVAGTTMAENPSVSETAKPAESVDAAALLDENFARIFEGVAEERRAPDSSAQLGDYKVLPPVNSASHLVKESEVAEIDSGKIRPLAQLHNSFIIAVDDEGLLLVDQHVAHERILFDKFRQKELDRNIESQNLLLPEILDLSPAQAEVFAGIEEELGDLGFGIMRLSGRTVAIKSIPTDLPVTEARNLLREILDNVELETRGGAKATLRDEIAASLACKAAVKINMSLTPEKMHWLIENLLTTSSPTTCPHGRPVILRLSMKDIERGFHRS